MEDNKRNILNGQTNKIQDVIDWLTKSIAHGICSDVDIRFMMECSVSKQRT